MKVRMSDIRIKANPERVILKFLQSGVNHESGRWQRLISRVMSMTDAEVKKVYAEIIIEFGFRHRKFEHYIENSFKKILHLIPVEAHISNNRRKLLGAYFTKEYSIQSAALFNPSMVAHPDQQGLGKGEKRFIISLRSVGEGHISSIEFRSGIVDAQGNIRLDKETGFASTAEKEENKKYSRKNLLKNTAVMKKFSQHMLYHFEEKFTYDDYLQKLQVREFSNFNQASQETLFRILDTNYDVIADEKSPICERVIFPNAVSESMGMEDVRFVSFTDKDKTKYIGTYTAYNGQKISPQLIMTEDFVHFKVRTLYGDAVNDKGMALFPEKINDSYVMLGRQGGENITIMYSNDLFIWKDFKVIMTPQDSWGYVQLGNCGSPIKTKEGWLVITHAVGPIRKYVLGAILLDLENPAKIIKKLNKPLLSPNEEERDGYVPNVVYSCGAMAHAGNLILPYAMSDSATTFAIINIKDLLQEMKEFTSNDL